MITLSSPNHANLVTTSNPLRFGSASTANDRVTFGAKQSATTDYWLRPEVASNWDLNVKSGQDTFRVNFYNDYLRDVVVQPKAGMRIWDAGTGNGTFARSFAEKGAIVFATDLPSNIAIARKHINPSQRITYQACDINKSPFLLPRPMKRFDKIVCSMVLMDWEAGWKERDKLYKRFNKALKPNGELIITIKHPIRTRFEAEGITDVYENNQGGLVVKTNRPGIYLLEPATTEHGGKFSVLKHPDGSFEPGMIKYEKTLANGFVTHHVHRHSQFYTSFVGNCGFELKEVYGPLTPIEAQRSLLDKYLPVIQTMVFTKKENRGTYICNTGVPNHLNYFSPMGDDVSILKPDDPRLQKPESVID